LQVILLYLYLFMYGRNELAVTDGEIHIQHISKEDVSDAEYISLLSQVRGLKGFSAVKCLATHINQCVCVCVLATEAIMTELFEDILSCGYNGPVNFEKRE